MDNNHISVWGRTLAEYTKMFALTGINSSAKLLSVADGPSTFNLQLRESGIDITSVDPVYNLDVDELKTVFKKSYVFNRQLFIENPQNFNFKSDAEMEQLLLKRQSTFDLFIADYEQNRSNYHYGKLPELDFPSNSFDLCLCSNLLFIFDHIFDLDFHIASIKELLRLGAEVRVFPLYNINGEESARLKPLTMFLTSQNIPWEIVANDYHVYKNGNRFLKINH